MYVGMLSKHLGSWASTSYLELDGLAAQFCLKLVPIGPPYNLRILRQKMATKTNASYPHSKTPKPPRKEYSKMVIFSC